MNATIHFTCPRCSHTMKLPASAAGKKGKCPACGAVVEITSTAAENPSAGLLEIGPDPLSVTPQDPGADTLGSFFSKRAVG